MTWFRKNADSIAHDYIYIGLMSIVAIIGWYFNNLTVSYVGLSCFLVLTPLLTKDVKTLLPVLPLAMTSFRKMFYFDSIPVQIYIFLASFAFSIILFVIRNILVKNVHFKFNLISKSLLFLTIILTLSAAMRHIFYNEPAFSEYQDSYNIMIGYLVGAGVFLVFLVSLFFSCFKTDGNDDYFVKVFYIFSIYILFQHIIGFIWNDYGVDSGMYTKIGWCDKNTMQVPLEFCLPFLAYVFSKNHKRVDAILIMALLMVFSLTSNSRGAQITMVVMAPLLLYLMVRTLKHKWIWYIGTAIVGVGCIATLYFVVPVLHESINRLIDMGMSLSGRSIFWEWILDYVYGGNALKAIFGGSAAYLFELFPPFLERLSVDVQGTGLLLCHNTLYTAIAIGGTLGAIGIAYFCWEGCVNPIFHCKDKAFVYFLVFFGELIHGLVDNNIFNIIFLFPIIIILSSYEKRFTKLF